MSVSIIFLGGLEEVGMNSLLLSWEGRGIIIDAGMGFADPALHPGVDYIIPSFEYIESHEIELEGILLTHGHKDHIGAIAHLLKVKNAPLYGSEFTLALTRNELKYAKISAEFRPVQPFEKTEIGPFSIEWLPISHSIPSSFSLNIDTPDGRIFHSGDFKFNFEGASYLSKTQERLQEIAQEGVDLLLCDSTNIFQLGRSHHEASLIEPLDEIFEEAQGQIFFVTFSTNIERIKTALLLARRHARRPILLGKSILQNVTIAEQLHLLSLEKGLETYEEKQEIEKEEEGEKLLFIVTGSQGEPNAAMSRIAKDDHPEVAIQPDDVVIWSSSWIPGNEPAIARIVNALTLKGARIFTHELYNIHVSGHAPREDLKAFHRLMQPRFFVPIHGEPRFLLEHRNLALSLGRSQDSVFLCQNGDRLNLHAQEVTRDYPIDISEQYINIRSMEEVAPSLLKKRKNLAEQGVVSISIVLNREGKLFQPPSIRSMALPENEEELAKWSEWFQETAHFNTRRQDLIELFMKEKIRGFYLKHWGIKPAVLTHILFVE